MRPFDPALIKHLPAARLPLAVLSLLGVLSGLAAVGQALSLAWLIVHVATGGDLGTPVAVVVTVLGARGLLAALSEYAGTWAGQRVSAQVRSKVLRRWLAVPVEQRPAPDIALTRAAEGTTAIEPYVAKYLPAMVSAVVVPVLTLSVLAVVDIWSALTVALTVPLMPLFAALIGKHTQDETARRRRALTTLAGHFLDVVRGLPTLVAYGRARFQVDQVARVGRRHQQATARTLRTAFMSTLALELLSTISVALVAVGVGLRLAEGWIGLYVGLAAILLAPEAYWPIRRVGAEFHNAADGQLALAELNDDLAAASEGVERPPDRSARAPGTVHVGLYGVSYAYPGGREVLTDVTLTSSAAPGLTAVTAPSGRGKTTVLDLFAGLRAPASGQVHAPALVHYATQRPLLIDGTVRQNMHLAAPGAADETIWQVLDRVGLGTALRERQGLGTMLGDDGFGLSAGQRARLALARADLSGADLVLLDEPTAHIALGAQEQIHDVIARLAQRRRVIVATHDEQLAARAQEHWGLPLPTGASVTTQRATSAMAGSATADRHSDTEHKGFALTKDEQADPTEEEPARVAGPQPEQQRVGPLPWWRTRRGRFVLACLFGGLSAGFGVALTATSGWLIVRAWQQPVILTLLVAIVGVRAFGLGRPVFRYAERVASHDVVLADLVRRRTETYRRLIPLTPARLGRRRRADLLTAVVHDLDDDVNATSRVWVPLAGALIASGVAVAILGLILPPAAFVLALATIIIAVTGLGVLALERPAHRREVRARGTLRQSITVLTTQTDAIRAVHSAGTPPPLTALAHEQQQQARAAGTSAAIRAGAVAVSWLVVAGSILVIAAQAAAAYTSGGLSPPVAAMVALTPIALADVWNTIPESFGQAARAQAARARLAAVLEQEPAVTDPGPQAGAGEQPGPRATTTGAETAGVDVHLEQVSARWAGQGEVDLQPLDLDARPGAHVVLTGPNGAGKSTALAVLARHLDPLSGQYRQGGRSVFAMSLEEARARIAIVDDEPHVFNGTVRANLALARPGATSFQMVTALQAVGLGPWLSGLSGGLDAHLQGLSGGERTRLSLARAFLSGRPVLLLDEPTAHLDTSTADAVLEAIATECAARTVVMVSHEHSWRLDPHAWERVEIHPDRRATAMRGQELAASPST